MHRFSLNVMPRDAGVIVQVCGDASVNEADHLRNGLQPILRRNPQRIVLDLTALEFINSLGLGVLLEFRKDAQEHGVDLRLAGASDRIADLLQKTRLVELFPLYASAETAYSGEAEQSA